MPRAIGQVDTAAQGQLPVSQTVYNEPTTNAQRSFKSSSASDSAAGTGARTVRLTYLPFGSDGGLLPAKTEDVALNGTTFVATVATDIGVVEKIEVLTAGSGGVADGVITLYQNAIGTSTALTSIAAGKTSTWLGHHYVPTGYQCFVTDIAGIGTVSGVAFFEILETDYPIVSAGVPHSLTGVIPMAGPQTVFPAAEKGPIVGPSRLQLVTDTPDDSAYSFWGSFGYYQARAAAY